MTLFLPIAVETVMLALFIFLAFYFRERDTWRRTAWRASQMVRNQNEDGALAQQVARDFANRGFKK